MDYYSGLRKEKGSCNRAAAGRPIRRDAIGVGGDPRQIARLHETRHESLRSGAVVRQRPALTSSRAPVT
jgi:hypothetical protein